MNTMWHDAIIMRSNELKVLILSVRLSKMVAVMNTPMAISMHAPGSISIMFLA